MLKKILSSFLGVVLAINMVASISASALERGDIVFQLTPAEQEIDLTPGQEFTGQVKVKNTGRLALTVTPKVKPFQMKGENYDPDFATENAYTKLQNWVSFEQAEYYIEPGAEVIVPYHVQVPLDVPGGGQYAAVVIETRDGIEEGATFQTVSQLASLVYAHVAGEEHVGGVLLTHSLPKFLLGAPFSAKARVKNDGNVDFRFQQTLTIYDFFTGHEVLTPDAVTGDGKTPGKASPIVLPETERASTLTWEGAPQLGVFRAVQTISFLDQEYSFEQIVFICPIWLAGVVVFLIGLMVLWLVLRIRKRRRERPQVL